jgi:NCS1 family nucleobase:cation symporter-1
MSTYHSSLFEITLIFLKMLTAIWPSFANLPNHLPASAGLTTAGMISYFLYWLIQFPMLLIPTHKLQYMFWVKTVLMPPVAIGMVCSFTS